MRKVLSLLVVLFATFAVAATAGSNATGGSGYKQVGAWGKTGTGNSQFSGTGGIAVDAHGNVYVADRDNNRVQVFSASGSFLRKWGSIGTGDGQFTGADDIAVAPDGSIWVAERDHAAGTTSTPFKLGDPFADEGATDNHNNPAVLVRSQDRRIVAAWCSHEDNRVRRATESFCFGLRFISGRRCQRNEHRHRDRARKLGEPRVSIIGRCRVAQRGIGKHDTVNQCTLRCPSHIVERIGCQEKLHGVSR